jgi:hypothetical protein
MAAITSKVISIMAEPDKIRPDLLFLVHSRPLSANFEARIRESPLSAPVHYQSLPSTQHESEYPRYLTLHAVHGVGGPIDTVEIPGNDKAVEIRQYQLVHSTSAHKWDGKGQCPNFRVGRKL